MPIRLPPALTRLLRILVRLVFPHGLAPAERILHLAQLDRLELRKQLGDGGSGLVAAALVLEDVVARAHGDGFDGHEGRGGAGRGDFAEGGEFVVFDLDRGKV